MSKEEAKDALIEVLMNQVVDLTMMSKIELGDDVIAEIKRLKEIINQNKDDMKREWEGKKLRWEIEKYLKSKNLFPHDLLGWVISKDDIMEYVEMTLSDQDVKPKQR